MRVLVALLGLIATVAAQQGNDCKNAKYKAAYGTTFTGNGIITFYSDGGGGACGSNSENGQDPLYGKLFAACSVQDYWGGGNSNLDPICRDFCALVSYGSGQPVEVKVMDMCHECPKNHLDLSQTAFQKVTGTTPAAAGTLGKAYNATIKFQKCSKGPSGIAGWAKGTSAASVCKDSEWNGSDSGSSNGTAGAGAGSAGSASGSGGSASGAGNPNAAGGAPTGSTGGAPAGGAAGSGAPTGSAGGAPAGGAAGSGAPTGSAGGAPAGGAAGSGAPTGSAGGAPAGGAAGSGAPTGSAGGAAGSGAPPTSGAASPNAAGGGPAAGGAPAGRRRRGILF